MGGVVGEEEKEWLFITIVHFINDEFFSAGSEEIGGKALVEVVPNFGVLIVELLLPAGVCDVVGVMGVTVTVTDVTKEVIETSLGGVSGPGGRVSAAALGSPLSDEGGGVSNSLQSVCEVMIVFQFLVELVVADVGVTLVEAGQQRGT